MGENHPITEAVYSELSSLSHDAKEFLNHHICSSLTVIINAIKLGKYAEAEKAAWHINDDLVTAGIKHRR